MLMNSNEYVDIIEAIKKEIKGAQYKATVSVNRELILLYYHIGQVINEHKTWGNKFIENLAAVSAWIFRHHWILGEESQIYVQVRFHVF